MAKYVRVIFISNNRVNNSAKKYLFGDLTAQCIVGSIIKDDRYEDPMFVVECLETTSSTATIISGGNPVKNLQISSTSFPSRRYIQQLGIELDITDAYKRIVKKPQINNILVSLEEAKQWYKSGNSTLVNLALKVFPKEDFEELNYEVIKKELESKGISMVSSSVKIPVGSIPENILHGKLATIARYFNGCNWIKKPDEVGFFINLGTSLDGYSTAIQRHCTVTQPGIIYFKKEEDARKAKDMVSEDLKMYM